jgi:hypothetical protein
LEDQGTRNAAGAVSLRAVFVAGKRQSGTHSVSFGRRCLYRKPYRHMGKGWHVSRGCSKKWRLELGRGAAQRARPFLPPPSTVPWYVLILSPCSKRRPYHLQLVLVWKARPVLFHLPLCRCKTRSERLSLVSARIRPLRECDGHVLGQESLSQRPDLVDCRPTWP